MTSIGISHADIVTTHACNKNCKFCIDKFRGTSSDIISLDHIKKFLLMLKENTHKLNFAFDTNPKLEVLLLGGEPTMLGSDYLIEIAKLIHSFDFEICISTNGMKKDVIKSIMPYFDWIQITCATEAQIDYWKPYKNQVNIKLAGDKLLTIDKFMRFIDYTKDFARRSLTMYFKPNFEQCCPDEELWNYLETFSWERLGSYLYTNINGVRVKKCIEGVTNVIEEPLIPKLYPNGNYNKTWTHESMDDYLTCVS